MIVVSIQYKQYKQYLKYSLMSLGVMLKATARMDEMQKETDELRASIASTTGQVQV